MELDQEQVEQIKKLVSFKRMHEQKPDHVRKGRSGNWVDILNNNQKRRVDSIAGSLLKMLGYPLSDGYSPNGLPALPAKIDPKKFGQSIKQAKSQYRAYIAKQTLGQFVASPATIAPTFRKWLDK